MALFGKQDNKESKTIGFGRDPRRFVVQCDNELCGSGAALQFVASIEVVPVEGREWQTGNPHLETMIFGAERVCRQAILENMRKQELRTILADMAKFCNNIVVEANTEVEHLVVKRVTFTSLGLAERVRQ